MFYIDKHFITLYFFEKKPLKKDIMLKGLYYNELADAWMSVSIPKNVVLKKFKPL